MYELSLLRITVEILWPSYWCFGKLNGSHSCHSAYRHDDWNEFTSNQQEISWNPYGGNVPLMQEVREVMRAASKNKELSSRQKVLGMRPGQLRGYTSRAFGFGRFYGLEVILFNTLKKMDFTVNISKSRHWGWHLTLAKLTQTGEPNRCQVGNVKAARTKSRSIYCLL